MATDVPSLFAALLVIDQRQAAEAQLLTLSAQDGFLPHLLLIVLDPSHPLTVRQSACLYLKNQIKNRWSGEASALCCVDFKLKTRELTLLMLIRMTIPKSQRPTRLRLGIILLTAWCSYRVQTINYFEHKWAKLSR